MDTRERHYQALRSVVLLTAKTLLPRRHNHLWDETIGSGEAEPMKKWTYLMDGLDFLVRMIPADGVARVDALLAAQDQPRLSDIQKRWSKDYRRIVRAGKLRKKTDEALIVKVLASSNPIHHAEKDDLKRMLTEYEEKA